MEFRILKNRLYYSTFAFAKADRDLKNNTSVVLLLEWRGRRLLFTGDAEWKGKPVKEYSSNGCWDIMLSNKDVRHHLEKIDFLKVGHHGSINGTPFEREGGSQEMLNMILPSERKNMAKAVVSTLSGAKDKIIEIPYPPLMDELGKRICNAKKYVHSNRPLLLQPERTDCCSNEKFWIDVEIEPDKKWNK
jgi:hypothetical protein